jgi:hypothetical protein
VSPTTWIILAIIGGIALTAVLRAASKPNKATGGIPLPPGGVVVPVDPISARAAPRLLPILGLSTLWADPFQEGSWEKFQTTYETHDCGATEYGIEDNGTGPHEVLIEATVRETGAMQPFYRADTDEWCNGQRIPSGSFYWYPGAVRPWTKKTTGGCNPVITDYPAGKKPTLPADGKDFTVDFKVRAWNRFGKEATPLLMSPRVAQHLCGDEGKTPTPAPVPCPKGPKKK